VLLSSGRFHEATDATVLGVVTLDPGAGAGRESRGKSARSVKLPKIIKSRRVTFSGLAAYSAFFPSTNCGIAPWWRRDFVLLTPATMTHTYSYLRKRFLLTNEELDACSSYEIQPRASTSWNDLGASLPPTHLVCRIIVLRALLRDEIIQRLSMGSKRRDSLNCHHILRWSNACIVRSLCGHSLRTQQSRLCLGSVNHLSATWCYRNPIPALFHSSSELSHLW